MINPFHINLSRKSSLYIFGFLVLFLGATTLIKRGVAAYFERRAESIVSEKSLAITIMVQSAFAVYERETIDSVLRVIESTKLREIVSQYAENSSPEVFDILMQQPQGTISLEVFDRAKHIVGWAGNQGPVVDTSMFTDGIVSFVLPGPIYSYLIIVTPLKVNNQSAGFLIGKRLFDVNYPINNRFISNKVFRSIFPLRVPFHITFDFSPNAVPNADSSQLSVSLLTTNHTTIGYAYVSKPSLSGHIEDVNRGIEIIQAFLSLIIVGWILFFFIQRVRDLDSLLLKGVAWTFVLWLFRYVLFWFSIPSLLNLSDLFDPKYFASPFGFGVAGSLGETFITSLALLVNVIMVSRFSVISLMKGDSRTNQESVAIRSLLFIGICVMVIFLLMAMRGFSSLIHSAVFDSALPYNDPTTVLPSVPLAVMYIILFLAAISFVVTACVTIVYMIRFMNRAFSGSPRIRYVNVVTFVTLIAGSIIFGLVQDNPLMSQESRLIYLFVLFSTARGGWYLWQRTHPKVNIKSTLLIIGTTLLLLVPLLDSKVHELDRTHVELLGEEIIRPEDSWLTFVVNRSLDELSNPGTAYSLGSGYSNDVEKLAFTQWAKSILSQEGNNCSVTYVRPDGIAVSDFHIGIPAHRLWEHTMESMPSNRQVRMEKKIQNNETIKWYIGYAPILDANGSIIGAVWVELSGNRQSLLRGETSDILRNSSKEEFTPHSRTLILSEYYHGKMITTTSEKFSLDRPLPQDILQSLPSLRGLWYDDLIDGVSYETYFLREDKAGVNSWIALSLRSLDLRWHLYTFLRYIFFYFILVLLAVSLFMAFQIAQGKIFKATVQMKLLIAFIVVSLIPVIILAYYNRQYAVERAEELTQLQLSEQTTVVASEIQRELGINIPVALKEVVDEQCVQIASDLNTDFNVYIGSTLQASSKPEIFSAELLDQRLSAQAFVNLVYKKKPFFVEHQSIGLIPYVVGYRPILAEDGSIIGVISVPTLYRQTEIDEELSKRNIFLYGSYAIALLLSIIVGTVFANQISSPIRRLKEAIKRMSHGDMEFELNEGSNDELGELERAFKEMTSDLRRAQEQMVRAERELAWREMAKQVAHEIKNPLTPIKLSIQHLRKAYQDGVKDFSEILERVSTTILAQIETLSRIASEFSHFATMPERQYEALDVHQIVNEAKNLFEQHGGISFRLLFNARQFTVDADREELRRAFINILRNSIQAMNETGTIIISSQNEGNFLAIDFTDDGPGISPEIKERLFEPSFSTKTDGMGLGLTIIRKTITDFGGDVSISSALGKGTTVTIRIPFLSKEK